MLTTNNKQRGPKEHPYYGARVKVGRDTIMFDNEHDEKAEIRFEEISKISVISYVEQHPQEDYWLYFWPFIGGGNVSIPAKAGGFQNLLEALKQWPDFDSEKLYSTLQNLGNNHILIYEKRDSEIPITAKIIPTQKNIAFNQIEQGLWLDNREELIPWGNYSDLDRVKGVKKKRIFPPNPLFHQFEYRLEKTTILNGIQINLLLTQTPSIRKAFSRKYKTWPVTGYWAAIILGKSGEETLSKLCRHISDSWRSPDKVRKDYAMWAQGRVKLELKIYNRHEFGTYDQACLLKIGYTPDLTRFYTNAYQQNVQLKNLKIYSVFPLKFKITHDYIHTPNAFYTPKCFEQLFDKLHQGLIWIDERKQKIGFANSRYCRVFKWKKNAHLVVEVQYWRDKLSGYVLGYADSKYGEWQRVAAFNENPKVGESDMIVLLENLLGIPCERKEDRQYY